MNKEQTIDNLEKILNNIQGEMYWKWKTSDTSLNETEFNSGTPLRESELILLKMIKELYEEP